MGVKYGNFSWTCPHCHKSFNKNTKQGLGMARSNHLRVHGINTEVERWKKEGKL